MYRLAGQYSEQRLAHYIALTRPAKITTNFRPNFKSMKMAIFFHYGSETDPESFSPAINFSLVGYSIITLQSRNLVTQ
jgi:hypothetical protein